MSKLSSTASVLALAFSLAAGGGWVKDHYFTAPPPKVLDTSDIVAMVRPSVVSIQSTIPAGVTDEDGDVTKEEGHASGTGLIYDGQKGYIINNNHVVANASLLKVLVNGNETPFTATVVGADKLSDIAVLKISSNTVLPQVTLGNSDTVPLASSVIAIGGPFGLINTVTTGIISTVNRHNVNQGSPFDDFLQTDASINPGNSGGPLFNMQGQVIGVNSEIFSPTHASVGLGFAIPVNQVKFVADKLIADGVMHWGRLGIVFEKQNDDAADATIAPVPNAKAPEFNAKSRIVVASVVPGGPAEQGGLKAGDIITTVNGQDMKSSLDLQRTIVRLMKGATPDIGIVRDGKAQHLTVTLGEIEAPKVEAKKDPAAPKTPPGVIIPNMPGLNSPTPR